MARLLLIISKSEVDADDSKAVVDARRISRHCGKFHRIKRYEMCSSVKAACHLRETERERTHVLGER